MIFGAIKGYGQRALQGKAGGTYFIHLMITLGAVGYGLEYYAFGQHHVAHKNHELQVAKDFYAKHGGAAAAHH